MSLFNKILIASFAVLCAVGSQSISAMETDKNALAFSHLKPFYQELDSFRKDETKVTFSIHTINETINQTEILYGAYLHDAHNTKLGSCKIKYNPQTRVAFCYSLWVHQNDRQQGIGTYLAAMVAKFLASYDCRGIAWHVEPHDLRDGEQKDQMMSKLIKFYEALGATYYKDLNCMFFDIQQQTDIKALIRAVTLANHVAQSDQPDTVMPEKAYGRINIVLNHLQNK